MLKTQSDFQHIITLLIKLFKLSRAAKMLQIQSRRAICCLIFLIGSFSYSSGQVSKFSISGKVIDGQNNQALAFSSISIIKTINNIESQLAGASANETGEFIFTNIAGGDIKLRVTFIGYKQLEKSFFLNENINLGKPAAPT